MCSTQFVSDVLVQGSRVLTEQSLSNVISSLSLDDKAKILFYLFKDFINVEGNDCETLLKLYNNDYVKVIKSILK